MVRKYAALRFFAGLIKVLGALSIIVGVLGLASAIYLVTARHYQPAIGVNVLWSFVPIVSGIFWWAMAELIYVFIDIEYNTRHWTIEARSSITDVAAD